MLAAPGSMDVTRLSTYANLIGPDDDDIQGANDLSKRYLPLARKIARSYGGRGISDGDLRSAAELGLTLGSRKFDPKCGAFGPYVSLWIKGEITKLFKSRADALASEATKISLDTRFDEESDETFTLHDVIADERTESPCPNLSGLSDRETRVVVGIVAGETLKELGSELGVSQERVRQINVAATKKLRKIPGRIALACIRDLTKRRGYHKPSRPLLPYKERRSLPGLIVSKDEVKMIEASRPDLLSAQPEKQIDWYQEHTERLRWAELTAGVRR